MRFTSLLTSKDLVEYIVEEVAIPVAILGFPRRETQGPICLDCSYASDSKACDNVTICGIDELCHIEKLPWGSKTIYHLGCKSKNECDLWNKQDADAPERSEYGPDLEDYDDGRGCYINQAERTLMSTQTCKTCCQGDFCNRNCTFHISNPQTIVG